MVTQINTETLTDTNKNNLYPEIDLNHANILATGLNKKQLRVVNGLGSFMGSKEMTSLDLNSNPNSVPINNGTNKNKRHISEEPWTFSNWHKHLNWLNIVLVIIIPLIGFAVMYSGFIPLTKNVFYFAIFYYVIGGISITAGYHRLWSHRSYEATWPLRLFFAFFGAASVEGSIKWWGHSHRIHHRYTDTPRDPYDARKGLFYSHMGWMILIPNPKYKARADISDLNDDWIVRFQHRHYILIMLLSAFILPTLICGYLFNDYWGGFIYAGIIRVFCIQQATFCINSMAHYIGTQPFDDRRTPRDNWMTAIVTFGEGYHNFHHEFPTDYRNAIKWYQYDPTKLLIYTTYLFGLSKNLKRFSQNIINEGILQQLDKKLQRQKLKVNWGPSINTLPIWDHDEFAQRIKKNPNLIIIGGIVHDITNYINEHPGGKSLIMEAAGGKDATKAFTGGVYRHSNAAHNVLADLRVAIIKEKINSASAFVGRRGEHLEKKTN